MEAYTTPNELLRPLAQEIECELGEGVHVTFVTKHEAQERQGIRLEEEPRTKLWAPRRFSGWIEAEVVWKATDCICIETDDNLAIWQSLPEGWMRENPREIALQTAERMMKKIRKKRNHT